MRRRAARLTAAALVGLMVGGAAPMPAVVAVAPSGATVPERLLRISVTFAAPQFDGLPGAVALIHEDGRPIPGALIDQTLWSPDRRTATFLLDPGRVKTGLIAHDRGGWALRAGERVTLQVAGWAAHRWTVVAGGCVVPDLAAWSLDAPRAGSTDPLSLGFPGPIDAASRDLIAVADGVGQRIDGRARLEDAEQRWTFTPAAPWPRHGLRIVVHPRLESPCGDEIGEAFEHPAGPGLGPPRTAVVRGFSLR